MGKNKYDWLDTILVFATIVISFVAIREVLKSNSSKVVSAEGEQFLNNEDEMQRLRKKVAESNNGESEINMN